jgi:hypothetical protein
VFYKLRGWLCGMMAFDASDRTGTVDAVRAAIMLDVIESYLPELCVLPENYYVRDRLYLRLYNAVVISG